MHPDDADNLAATGPCSPTPAALTGRVFLLLLTYRHFGHDSFRYSWRDRLRLIDRNRNVAAIQGVDQFALRSLSYRYTLHGASDPIDRRRWRKIRCLCKRWRREEYQHIRCFFHSNPPFPSLGCRSRRPGRTCSLKHGRTVQSRWLRPLPRRSCSLRLFVAPPFAQQLIILSWVVAFEAIECIVRRLNGGSADLLFDCVDVPGGLFQTAQRFLVARFSQIEG